MRPPDGQPRDGEESAVESAVESAGGVSPFAPKRALKRSPEVKTMQADSDLSAGGKHRENTREATQPVSSGRTRATAANDESIVSNETQGNSSTADSELLGAPNTRVIELKQCAFTKMMTSCSEMNVIVSPGRGKGRCRLNSLPADTEEIVTGKRKNEMSPNKGPMKKGKTGAGATLQILETKVHELSLLIEDQINVKKETKLQIKLVTECLSRFKREYEAELVKADHKKLTGPEVEAIEFREKIHNANDVERVKEIITLKWPNGCFKNTRRVFYTHC